MSIIRKLVALLLICWTPSFAAFNSGLEWEVRTTGNDANGGAYDPTVAAPGTDFSQQDAAQQAYTDLVIDGTTNTKVTSAAHPFGATSPGNIINITAGTGFTVQRVEILSVAGSTATCDKSLGTLGSTGGTGNMGGALLTHTTPFSVGTAKNMIHTKSGTYTVTSAISVSGPASFTWEGYGTTHGDKGTKPLLTTSTNSTNIMTTTNNGASTIYVYNLSFSNTAGTKAIGISFANASASNYITVSNSDFTGFTNAVGETGASTAINMDVVEDSFTSNTLGVASAANTINVRRSYFDSNGVNSTCSTSGNVSWSGAGSMVIEESILARSTACGVEVNGAAGYTVKITNSAIRDNTGNGVDLTNVSANVLAPVLALESSILYGNGGWGVSASSTVPAGRYLIRNNGVGSNTSGNYTGVATLSGDVSLSASPFVSSTNAALNSTVGGGAALKGLGYPGAFAGGTTTGYIDIGPVQTQCIAASAIACGFSSLRRPDIGLRTQ